MRSTLLIIPLVLACTSADPAVPPPTSRVTQSVVTCPPVTQYGAAPDDGLDDRAAIQRSLDETGCLNLRDAPGRYDIDIPPLPRGMCAVQAPAGARLYGMPGATLAARGDAGQLDLGVVCMASGTTWERIEIDGDALRNTSEHARLMWWVGPVRGVTITRSRFWYPPRAGEKRGDCVQGIGYAPDWLSEDVTITHNKFVCGRAAFAWHSGTRGLIFEDNEMCSSDQEIDGEGRGNEPYRLLINASIRRNTFEFCGQISEGALAMQVVRGTNVLIADNTFNRGLDLADLDDSTLENNTITLSTPAPIGDPVVTVRKDSERLVIAGGRIVRLVDGGPVISIERRETGPSDVTLRDLTLEQHASWHPVRLVGTTGVVLQDLDVEYLGASTAMSAVTIEGIGAMIEDTSVTDLRTTGPLRDSLFVSGAYVGAGRVRMEYSSSSAPVRCDDAYGILGPLELEGNAAPAPVGCSTAAPRRATER